VSNVSSNSAHHFQYGAEDESLNYVTTTHSDFPDLSDAKKMEQDPYKKKSVPFDKNKTNMKLGDSTKVPANETFKSTTQLNFHAHGNHERMQQVHSTLALRMTHYQLGDEQRYMKTSYQGDFTSRH
jgi:hypothetical protein